MGIETERTPKFAKKILSCYAHVIVSNEKCNVEGTERIEEAV